MNYGKTLRLAIARSLPPQTMPGYWMCWRTWQIVARSLGISRRHDPMLLLGYQAAAHKASIRADLQAQEDEICGGPAK